MELLEKDEEYIISLLEQGKKVEAVAFVKNKTGMNLKEAKDYIDKKANNEYYEENISIINTAPFTSTFFIRFTIFL